jgi:hypothetical protein
LIVNQISERIFDALVKQCPESHFSWLGLGAGRIPSFGNPKAPSKNKTIICHILFGFFLKQTILDECVSINIVEKIQDYNPMRP